MTPTAPQPQMIPAWVGDTLQPVEKLEVHRRGLRHKAVSVFVMRGPEVLIQQRAFGKYHSPGLWANTCCTHPHWNEPAETCAHRRLDEELGLNGLSLRLADRLEYRADVGQGLIEHEVVDIFLADTPEDAPRLSPTPDPDEVAATRWITLDALRTEVQADPARFSSWLAIYLGGPAERIFRPLRRS